MTNTPALGKRAANFLRILSFIFLFPAHALLASDVKTEETSMSQEAAEKALEGKQTYNFAVLKSGEIVDQDGRHFTAKTAKEYLERAKPEPKAAYMFWIPDSSAVETAKALVEPFGNYGVTLFFIREMDSSKKPKPAPADKERQKETVMFVGEANPKSLTAKDEMPKMTGRPEHLRPGKLPNRVRCVFSPDSEVVAAAKKAETLLLGEKNPDMKSFFDGMIVIQPGAWSFLVHQSPLDKVKPLTHKIELGRRIVELDGAILDKSEEFTVAVQALRKLIAKDGGGHIRAFTSTEMNLWWTYITFDIEEPVFVLETNGGKFRFIVGFNSKGCVNCLDELNFFTPPTK